MDGKMGDSPARIVTLCAQHDAVGHVDRACQTAIVGRRAARALAEWAKRFELSEAELQLLWRLRSAPSEGLDQTALSVALTFSPAQISASVERLRVRGWVCARGVPGDRRRHRWQLLPAGLELIDTMLSAAALLRYQPEDESRPNTDGNCSREVAA